MTRKSKITVLVDTREQKPFPFVGSPFIPKVHKLETGDYTLRGLESRLCIERKGSVDELIANLHGSKTERFRQLSSFERMTQYPLRFLVIEATASEFFVPARHLPFTVPTQLFVEDFWNTILTYQLQTLFIGRRSGRSLRFFWSFLNTIWTRWEKGLIE